MFTPGQTAMAPVNLSSKKELRFFARGEEGRSYAIMIFARSKGQMPVIQRFTTSAEWKEVIMPIASFAGSTAATSWESRSSRAALRARSTRDRRRPPAVSAAGVGARSAPAPRFNVV